MAIEPKEKGGWSDPYSLTVDLLARVESVFGVLCGLQVLPLLLVDLLSTDIEDSHLDAFHKPGP